MSEIRDGYYFMFETGWFLDLLIPTLVRVKNGELYLVGSKPYQVHNVRPCCIPAGGIEECRRLPFDDPSLRAFKCIDSLIAITNLEDLEGELTCILESENIRGKYFTSRAHKLRKATLERVLNDYKVLSTIGR